MEKKKTNDLVAPRKSSYSIEIILNAFDTLKFDSLNHRHIVE